MKIEDAYDLVGKFGRYQKVLLFLYMISVVSYNLIFLQVFTSMKFKSDIQFQNNFRLGKKIEKGVSCIKKK